MISVSSLDGLSSGVIRILASNGFNFLEDFSDVYYPDVYELIGFSRGKVLLNHLVDNDISVRFKKPSWDESRWLQYVDEMVDSGLVTWQEIALCVSGELNPPQVGTAIASNKSFQSKFPERETMKNVMEWFYAQDGTCQDCGTRLFLEADHIIPKEDFVAAGRDSDEADTLDNLQLLCKRCNTTKRQSHTLGKLSFATAQAALMWIVLNEKPSTKEDFYNLCRDYGLTMANVRFDEAWAFAVWARKGNSFI